MALYANIVEGKDDYTTTIRSNSNDYRDTKITTDSPHIYEASKLFDDQNDTTTGHGKSTAFNTTNGIMNHLSQPKINIISKRTNSAYSRKPQRLTTLEITTELSKEKRVTTMEPFMKYTSTVEMRKTKSIELHEITSSSTIDKPSILKNVSSSPSLTYSTNSMSKRNLTTTDVVDSWSSKSENITEPSTNVIPLNESPMTTASISEYSFNLTTASFTHEVESSTYDEIESSGSTENFEASGDTDSRSTKSKNIAQPISSVIPLYESPMTTASNSKYSFNLTTTSFMHEVESSTYDEIESSGEPENFTEIGVINSRSTKSENIPEPSTGVMPFNEIPMTTASILKNSVNFTKSSFTHEAESSTFDEIRISKLMTSPSITEKGTRFDATNSLNTIKLEISTTVQPTIARTTSYVPTKSEYMISNNRSTIQNDSQPDTDITTKFGSSESFNIHSTISATTRDSMTTTQEHHRISTEASKSLRASARLISSTENPIHEFTISTYEIFLEGGETDNESSPGVLLLFGFMVLVTSIGLIANLVALLTLLYSKQRFSTRPTRILLINQTFVDTFVCVLGILIFTHTDMSMTGNEPIDFFLCQALRSQAMFWIFVLLSVWNVVFIAFDRFQVINNTGSPRNVRIRRRKVVLMIMYIVSAILLVPACFQVRYDPVTGVCEEDLSFMENDNGDNGLLKFWIFYGYVWFFTMYIIPIGCLVAMYAEVVLELKRTQRTLGEILDKRSSHVLDTADRQVTQMAITIGIIFIISLSWDAFYCLLGFTGVTSYEFNSLLQTTGVFLATMDSCATPFIYLFTMSEFRAGVKETFFGNFMRCREIPCCFRYNSPNENNDRTDTPIPLIPIEPMDDPGIFLAINNPIFNSTSSNDTSSKYTTAKENNSGIENKSFDSNC